jgi:hypothetical protein
MSSKIVVAAPNNYLEPPTIRTAYRHVCATTRRKVIRNTLLAGFLSTMGAGMVTVAAEGISHIVIGAEFWGLPLFAAALIPSGILSYARLALFDAETGDRKALGKFKTNAESIVSTARSHVAREEDPHRYAMDNKELGALMDKAAGIKQDAQSIMDVKDPDMLHIRRRMILRLSAVHTAYSRSINDLGSAPRVEVEQIASDAVAAIVRESIEERANLLGSTGMTPDDISRSVTDRMRQDVSKAMAMGAPKTDDGISTGTGHARIDRLVAKARETLAIDPDITDSTGARVDAAFNEHLPRLLKAHAESARHARIEDLGETDRQLEIGVEQIRSMLEEGLQTLRHEKADALRTEVGFLKLRRAASDTTLKAIEGGKAA